MAPWLFLKVHVNDNPIESGRFNPGDEPYALRWTGAEQRTTGDVVYLFPVSLHRTSPSFSMDHWTSSPLRKPMASALETRRRCAAGARTGLARIGDVGRLSRERWYLGLTGTCLAGKTPCAPSSSI